MVAFGIKKLTFFEQIFFTQLFSIGRVKVFHLSPPIFSYTNANEYFFDYSVGSHHLLIIYLIKTLYSLRMVAFGIKKPTFFEHFFFTQLFSIEGYSLSSPIFSYTNANEYLLMSYELNITK